MIVESLDEYLETVAGFIFDDDKLVTYKWLSKELEVHVNVAKHILWEFWQRNRNEKSFDCAFLLMGLLHDGGMRVEVVKEKNLSTAKEKFMKILSEHIYSIQKVLCEIQVLGLAEDGDVRYSAIKCLPNNERSDKDIHAIRWGAMSKEIQCAPPETTKSVRTEKESESVQEKREQGPEKKIANTKKAIQKKGFDNLFGKVSNKQKSPLSVTSNKEKMEVDTSNNTKPSSSKERTPPESSKKTAQKGGLSSFLQQSKNSERNTNSASPEEKKNAVPKVKANVEKSTSAKDNKQKKNTRGQKRNRSKETNNATKRKRIAIKSDSSDNGSSDEEQEEEIEAPPSPEHVSPVRICSPSPPKVKLEGGKRKILKMVDKTFEEDGYLVTKKVHIYESCSEDETEVVEQPKKSVMPESRQEAKGKKNTKQTTLMSFFKKS